MKKLEVSCPNCGASNAVRAPHGRRICKYCGTEYALVMPETSPSKEDEEQSEGVRRWLMLRFYALIIAVGVVAGLLLFYFVLRSMGIEGPQPANQGRPGFGDMPDNPRR